MRKIVAEGFLRVEIVFGKREGAGGGGCPGVDERGLNDLILFGRAAHETAAVLDVNVHIGTQIEIAAELRILLPHDRGADDGIDFDAGNIVAAGGKGARYVPSPAGSD